MFQQESPYWPLLKILVIAGGFYLLLTHYPTGAGLLIILGVILFGLVGLFLIAHLVWSIIHNYCAPQKTVSALVLRKWTREYDIDLPTRPPHYLGPIFNLFFPSSLTVYEQWVFWASFKARDGELELALPEPAYVALNEGTEGLLTYKGEKFIRFRPKQ